MVGELAIQQSCPEVRSTKGKSAVSTESPTDLQQRVAAALDCIPDVAAEQRLMPHLCWMLREIIGRVTPEDLLPTEAMAMLAILTPAHARVLGLPAGGRPVLRIVPSAQASKGGQTGS